MWDKPGACQPGDGGSVDPRQKAAGLAGVVPSPSLWRVAQDILLADPALLVAVEAARRR